MQPMKTPSEGWHPEKLAYTMEEAAALLSLSRATVYHLVDLRELDTVKIGKSRRVTHAQLVAYIRRLEQRHGFVRLGAG
jgi:excisionase family DNA binding protein